MSADIVQFAFREEVLPETRTPNNMPGLPQIFVKLSERDLRPAVSTYAENAFTSTGVELSTQPGEDSSFQYDGPVELEDIGVIVNRIGRSVKMNELPGISLPPMINENATRSLAHYKIRAHHEVLAPLGIAIPTALPETPSDVDEFLAMRGTDKVVVKPNSGTNSEGVQIIEPSTAKKLFADDPTMWGKQLLQPAYDFTRPLPSDLRPYDAASIEEFEGWRNAPVPKELRVYGFHSPTGTDVFPVARAIKEGDNWFFVDPGSVPATVIENTQAAISRAAEVSGAAALFGTVDYGFAIGDTEVGPDWHAIELNARMPYLIGYDKHLEVADQLRELLADQILATSGFAA